MKKIFLMLSVIASVALFASCSSTQPTATNTSDSTYEVPCSGPDYRTDATTFRATANAVAGNEDVARKQATASARAELAASINSTIKAVSDNYAKNYVEGETPATVQRFEELARTVVSQKISGSHIICEKYQKMGEAKYRCYVCVQLATADVLSALNSSLSNDSKLKIDYDYEKFKKTFEEEMAKLAE